MDSAAQKKSGKNIFRSVLSFNHNGPGSCLGDMETRENGVEREHDARDEDLHHVLRDDGGRLREKPQRRGARGSLAGQGAPSLISPPAATPPVPPVRYQPRLGRRPEGVICGAQISPGTRRDMFRLPAGHLSPSSTRRNEVEQTATSECRND